MSRHRQTYSRDIYWKAINSYLTHLFNNIPLNIRLYSTPIRLYRIMCINCCCCKFASLLLHIQTLLASILFLFHSYSVCCIKCRNNNNINTAHTLIIAVNPNIKLNSTIILYSSNTFIYIHNTNWLYMGDTWLSVLCATVCEWTGNRGRTSPVPLVTFILVIIL